MNDGASSNGKGAIPLDKRAEDARPGVAPAANDGVAGVSTGPVEVPDSNAMMVQYLAFLMSEVKRENVTALLIVFCDTAQVPQHGLVVSKPLLSLPLLGGMALAEDDLRRISRNAVGDYLRHQQELIKKMQEEKAPKDGAGASPPLNS